MEIVMINNKKSIGLLLYFIFTILSTQCQQIPISAVAMIPTKGFVSLNKAYQTIRKIYPTKNFLASFISQSPFKQHVTLVGFNIYPVATLSAKGRAHLITKVKRALHFATTLEIQRTLRSLKNKNKGKRTPIALHFNNFEFFVLRFVGTFKATPLFTRLINNIEHSFKALLQGDKRIQKITQQQALPRPHISLAVLQKGMFNRHTGRKITSFLPVAAFHISKPLSIITAF